MAFRYVDIARISVSDRYCKLLWTTSDIGPNTAPRCEMPVFRRPVISSSVQPAKPASLDVREGAYQFCNGIRPPEKEAFFIFSAKQIDTGMTHTAMSQPFNEISAAIPLRGLRWVGPEFAVGKKQQTPANQQGAEAERKLHFVGAVGLVNGCLGTQVGINRVRISARNAGITWKWKGWIEKTAIFTAPGVHRPVKIFSAPCANAGLIIWRDVRRIQGAEWRWHRQSAGERLAAARGMACNAIACARQIFTASDQFGAPGRIGGHHKCLSVRQRRLTIKTSK